MSGAVIIVDTNAIRNLWAGGGPAMWDQLIKGSDHVVISKIILEELDNIEFNEPKVTRVGHSLYGLDNPHIGMGDWLRDWMEDNGIQEVDFEPAGLRDANGKLIKDSGEKTLNALINRANNSAADDALSNAGIPTDGQFRLLTDDAKALREIAVATTDANRATFDDDGLRNLGHGQTPYYGI
jgi:hypothetical protein